MEGVSRVSQRDYLYEIECGVKEQLWIDGYNTR